MNIRHACRKISVGLISIAMVIFLTGCPVFVNVPTVTGLAQAAAEAALVDAGLVVGAVTTQFSATVAEGSVISQSPAAGASVERGSSVSLVVSRGVEMVTVPGVAGEEQSVAEAAIVGAGLVVGDVTEVFNVSVPVGVVISQDPADGEEVPAGSAVNLVVSLGTSPGVVPAVSGLTTAEASLLIVASGFTVGDVTIAFSETVAAGLVISQSPASGTVVSAGTAVDLVVSLGPEGSEVPNVVGFTRSAAESAIVNAGFVVGTVTLQFSDTVPEGEVISQSLVGGSVAEPGTAIDLVVSSGADCVEVPALTGITERAAGEILLAAGLELGEVTAQFSTTVATGLISAQSFAEGECLEAGTAVNLTLSRGASIIQINDVDELQLIGNDDEYPLNGNYVLAANINAAKTRAWKGGLGFEPIGSEAAPFNGWFDGNGFVISGLVINRPEENNVGLFGYAGVFESLIEEARITNVVLSGGSVTGRDNVGAVCGYAGNGFLADCSSDLAVSGGNAVGGIVGFAGTQVSTCEVTGEVTATTGAAGGLIGTASDAFITDSSASGDVFGMVGVGGFAGANSGLITNCSASGAVEASSRYAGGLIGVNSDAGGDDAIVVDCFSTGDVTAGFEAGGLIGRNQLATSVSRCYATGNVTCTTFGGAGGLIGFNDTALVSESFATGTVSNISPWAGTGGLIGISGSSTIANCYALGAASGADRVGGLIGDATWNVGGGLVVNCLAVGLVTSPGDKGGLIGVVNPFAEPGVTGSYWDKTTTGQDTTSGSGLGLETAALQQATTYTNVGWDFDTVWEIIGTGAYPTLQFEGP